VTSDCPLPACALSHSVGDALDDLRRHLPSGTDDLAVGLVAAFLGGETAAWPASRVGAAAEVLRHADALDTFGGLGPIRPPRDDAGRASFVQRTAPRRELLEAMVDAHPDDLWSRLQLGLLQHCEGSAEAAEALDAAADRLADLGLVPNLVADLRFHAGLARLRRLEGAGEADGNGG
jgi:hypothetical protein